MKFIVPPNFYLVHEDACPPLQLEPFYNYIEADIVHLKRGQSLETIPEDDFYGITAYTEDYPMAKIIARFLKHRNPNCQVVLGGCHVTYKLEDIDREIFDHVVSGNGEWFFSKTPIEHSHQEVQWDSRSFEHFTRYNPNYHRHAMKSYTLRTSFGCYWKCYFCANVKWRCTKVQFREIGELGRQLDFLKEHGIQNLRVIDEIFTCHPQFETICKMLKGFSWNIQDRIDQLTPEKCKILKENGCNRVQIGIESFDENIRQKLNKCLLNQHIENGIKYALDEDLRLETFLMLGVPYDTEDSIKFNRDKAIELFGYENIRSDIFVPYVGSVIGDNPETHNLRILTVDPKYYSTFAFQNVHGRLVSVPQQITNVGKWEQLLFDTLYELAPQLIRDILNDPIKEWYTDEMYGMQL